MPQSYTIGSDSWQDIKQDDISGQTFRVLTPFLLQWVDLWLDKKPLFAEIVVQIFFAGGDHHPFGDCKSRDRVIIASESLPGGIHHVRFSMQPFLLDPLDYYCLQVNFYPPIWGGLLKWRYDAGDATYPRGHRIQSDDGGETWTDHVFDDHMFALWGTPPVPEPPPEPPINNASIIDIEEVVTATGMQLVVTTNVPCHLYAAYTLEKPLKHYKTRIVRGLPVPWDTRWCFINWTQNEQAEDGDTIVHTFTKEPWPSCQTRYFVFRGKVDGEWIPSASPIFTIHRVAPPITAYFYPDAHPEVSSCDGRASCYGPFLSWGAIHAGAGTKSEDADDTISCQLRVSGARPPDNYYDMWRTFISFDLTSIIGKTILSAEIGGYGQFKYNNTDISFNFAFFASLHHYYTQIVPSDYQQATGVLFSGVHSYEFFKIDDWNIFLLNSGAITYINNHLATDGLVKFCFREYMHDALNQEPFEGLKSKQFTVRFRSADNPLGNPPYLKVVYL